MEYTTAELVASALGEATGPAFTADAYGAEVVAAANAWVTRKRATAGYRDEDDPPGADVTMGATLYAVALWRERASVDSFATFEDSGAFAATGSMGQILRLIACPRSATDGATTGEVAAWRARRRRRRLVW